MDPLRCKPLQRRFLHRFGPLHFTLKTGQYMALTGISNRPMELLYGIAIYLHILVQIEQIFPIKPYLTGYFQVDCVSWAILV